MTVGCQTPKLHRILYLTNNFNNLNPNLTKKIVANERQNGVKLSVLLKNFNEQEFVRMFENIPLYLHIDLF